MSNEATMEQDLLEQVDGMAEEVTGRKYVDNDPGAFGEPTEADPGEKPPDNPPAPEKTPEEEPPPPTAEPAPEPVDDDDEDDTSKYSEQERRLYARMKKEQSRRRDTETELRTLRETVAELKGRLDATAPEQPGRNPNDFLTAGDFRDMLREYAEEAAQTSRQAIKTNLNAADQAGADFYGADWEAVTEDSFARLYRDPQAWGALAPVLQAGQTGKAARMIYEYCAGKKPVPDPQPRHRPAPAASVQSGSAPIPTAKPTQVSPTVVDRLVQRVVDNIGNCESEEQINQLLNKFDAFCHQQGL